MQTRKMAPKGKLWFFVYASLIGALASSPTWAEPSTHKVAVILYNFNDSAAAPVTKQQVKEMTFTATGNQLATGSVNSYFKEVTDDTITFQGHLDATGDVFGWYTLPRSLYHPDDGRVYACAEDLVPEIQAPAIQDGFDIDNYDFVIYASNVAACNGSWKGNKTIFAAAVALTDWSVYAHELGHGLGLAHANKVSCQENGTQVPWGGTCSVAEYEDGFSVMGWSGGLGHFSSVEKLTLGTWLIGRDVVEVTTTGSYSLKPVTTPSAQGGLRGLRVRTSTNPVLPNGAPLYGPSHSSGIYYYLEYRTAEKFNQTTQNTAGENRGVYVRTGVALEDHQNPLLLDMDPTTSSFALPEGVWYTDDASQVSFRVVPGSQTDLGVEIQVALAEATAPDYDRDGLTDIAFHRPGSNWATVPVLFSTGDGNWRPTNSPAPVWANQPDVVAIPGDFNDDGLADTAFHRPGSDWASVPVLFSAGDGSWRPTNFVAPAWANQPDVVAIPGDYNDDGHTDIAFHRPGSDWVSVPVLFSAGDGSWTSTNFVVPAWANQPDVVAIPGHFNNDGRTDIAFHRPGGNWATVPVLMSAGDGSWTDNNSPAPSWANQPDVVAITGRFDDDELTDVAFHRPGGNWATVPVLMSAGDGSWTDNNSPAPSWANQPDVVAVTGHFDDDELTDIAFHRPGSNWTTVPVLSSAGGGSWVPKNSSAPVWANQPDVIAIPGNFDNDRRTDIAFHRPGSSWITAPVLFSTGDGSWVDANSPAPVWAHQPGVSATTTATASAPQLLARFIPGPRFRRGDCNGDGYVDLSDAVCTLDWLFLGDLAPPCIAATNINGDEGVDLSDPVALLNHLFAGTAAPLAPFPECGLSNRAIDQELGCQAPPETCE